MSGSLGPNRVLQRRHAPMVFDQQCGGTKRHQRLDDAQFSRRMLDREVKRRLPPRIPRGRRGGIGPEETRDDAQVGREGYGDVQGRPKVLAPVRALDEVRVARRDLLDDRRGRPVHAQGVQDSALAPTVAVVVSLSVGPLDRIGSSLGRVHEPS